MVWLAAPARSTPSRFISARAASVSGDAYLRANIMKRPRFTFAFRIKLYLRNDT